MRGSREFFKTLHRAMSTLRANRRAVMGLSGNLWISARANPSPVHLNFQPLDVRIRVGVFRSRLAN
jgi:hypothetical protein